jgi:Rod binding domain-containing protein
MTPLDSLQNVPPVNECHSSKSAEQAKMRDIQLREKSVELEALFITQLFKAMEKTIPDGNLYGSSKNNLPNMLFSSVMGKAVAQKGGLGLSQMIYNSLREKDLPKISQQLNRDPLINSYNILLEMGSPNDE